jgi:hypothetical protein
MIDSRRNILKKMIGTLIASFAKPIQVLPPAKKFSTGAYGLKGAKVNISRFKKNDWFNIFSTITSSEKAEMLAQKARQQLSSIKINDELAKAIVNYVAKDGDTFADYVQETLLDKFPSNKNFTPDDVEQFMQQPLDKAMELLKDPKYHSAGDIYFMNAMGEPRVMYSAEKMMDNGLFHGDREIMKTLDSVINDAIKVVKSEMGEKKKAKAYANSIEYSPADYLGGAPQGGSEQHGYKLAVDHHTTDMKNLIALYEQVQQHH